MRENGKDRMRTKRWAALTAMASLLLPGTAWAGTGIGEFAAPIKAVVDTVTGTTARYISVAAMAGAGLTLFLGRNELDGIVKTLLVVVIAISFVAFASPIVMSVFGSGFEGALL